MEIVADAAIEPIFYSAACLAIRSTTSLPFLLVSIPYYPAHADDSPRHGLGEVHNQNASKGSLIMDGADHTNAALKGRACYANDLRVPALNKFWGI